MSAKRNNVHEIRGGGAAGGGDNGDPMKGVDARPTRLETVVEITLPNLAAKGDMQRVEGRLPYLAAKEDVRKIKVRVLVDVLGGIVLATTVVSTLPRAFLP